MRVNLARGGSARKQRARVRTHVGTRVQFDPIGKKVKKRANRSPYGASASTSSSLAARSVKRARKMGTVATSEGKRGRERGGSRGEVGDLTCYDGPENENNETKQCRADVTVN